MNSYVVFPRKPMQTVDRFALELIVVSAIIVIGVAVGLTYYLTYMHRAESARSLAFSYEINQYLAGRHIVTGTWPKNVDGVFYANRGETRNGLYHAAMGQWPPEAQPADSKRDSLRGNVKVLEGSYTLRGNMVSYGTRLDTISFALHDTEAPWPLAFSWHCGFSIENQPNETTLPNDHLLRKCRAHD